MESVRAPSESPFTGRGGSRRVMLPAGGLFSDKHLLPQRSDPEFKGNRGRQGEERHLPFLLSEISDGLNIQTEI